MTTKHPPWLVEALKDVGYKEKPGNDNKFGLALGMNKVPWCDLAVTEWCKESGHPLPSMQPGMKTGAAAVWYSIQFAKSHNLWVPSWKSGPGFQICYGWNGPNSTPEHMHTGFVDYLEEPQIGAKGHSVEGNRGDLVGKFTFTVGADIVLGTIDLPRLLLGRPKITVHKPKATDEPTPQPRNPAHPKHTGPTKADLKERIQRLQNKLRRIRRIAGGKHVV
jgi:hypothetical protein